MTERRPDASMSLLRTITDEALDPDYLTSSKRQAADAAAPGRPTARLRLGFGLGLAAALVTMAAVQTTTGATAADQERTELIGQVRRAEQQQDAQRNQLAALDAEVRRLQQAQGVGATPGDRAQELAPVAGTMAVTGPGVVVELSDAPRADGGDGLATDRDLRQVVNGLWQAGAEAIAVNGHRLTSRTAIRLAGTAITVDYRSVTSPYRVEAIGDPARLPAAFAATTGGAWADYLRQNYGLGFSVHRAERLVLPADPGLGVSRARPGS